MEEVVAVPIGIQTNFRIMKNQKKSNHTPKVYSVKKGRREFISNSIKGGAAAALMNGALSGCKKEDEAPRTENNSLNCHLLNHEDFINSIEINKNGDILIAGANNGKIIIWSLPNGLKIKSFQADSYRIDEVSLNPEGDLLAVAGNDGLKLWTFPEVNLIKGIVTPCDSVSFSPDGKYLATGGYNKIQIWSLPDLKLQKSLSGHEKYIHCVRFSHDGNLLASGASNEIKVWKVNDWSLQANLESSSKLLLFSPDDKILVSKGSEYKKIKIWSIDSLQLLSVIESVGSGIDIDAEGKLLVSGGSSKIELWSLENENIKYSIQDDYTRFIDGLKLDFSGNTLFSIHNNYVDKKYSVRVWDIPSRKYVPVENCCCDTICTCNSVSPNNLENTICTCNTVEECTCNHVCSCNSVCSCDNHSSGGGGSYWYPN